jgi:hypothetical protein
MVERRTTTPDHGGIEPQVPESRTGTYGLDPCSLAEFVEGFFLSIGRLSLINNLGCRPGDTVGTLEFQNL